MKASSHTKWHARLELITTYPGARRKRYHLKSRGKAPIWPRFDPPISRRERALLWKPVNPASTYKCMRLKRSQRDWP